MPRKPISFELDFMIKDILPRFAVKQFDDVSFNIKPKNQGLDYDITGTTGKIFVGVNNDMFMQTDGITISSNNINVLLDKNMLQKNGRAYAEIELTDSAGTITSSSFIFDIDPKIGEGGQIPGEYEGFVEKYERLISEFKSQVNSTINNCNDKVNITINNCNDKVNITINNCNTNVDNKLNSVDSLVNVKISDFEKRFNRLTSSQQQDAEVIDARVDFKGVAFDSLKERIDCTDKLLRDSTVSTIETESDFTTVEATSNGYFEDVKLEGKTLVNLYNKVTPSNLPANGTLSNVGDIYRNTNITTATSFLDFRKCFPLIKSNTTYTIILKDFKHSSDISPYLKIYGDNTCVWTGTQMANSNIFKVNVGLLADHISDYRVVLYSTGCIGGWVETSNEIIILEGDHTQNPPSYFEGLKSVGDGADEIVVSSVKGDGNLFDAELEMGNINNGIEEISTTQFRSDYVRVKSNTSYITNSNIELKYIYTYFYDKNKNYIGVSTTNVFTTPSNCMYIRVKSSKVDVSAITKEFLNTVKIGLVMSKVVIPYTPHQSDKKRLLYYNEETQSWEKPILREWDSIEKHADGKYYYHQRSAEVVLNGSEGWRFDSGVSSQVDTICFTYNDETLLDTGNLKCTSIVDKFKVGAFNTIFYNEDCELYSTGWQQHFIKIQRSKLSTQDAEGFKQWLQTNNVTVVYQLAQEKVYECTNIDLITYANETNYIVESGAIVPKTTLKVHNNISNVVSLLQKKVSLLESDITSYMITQNRLMLASRYNADTVSFKVDVASFSDTFEYDNDLYELILNNILVGKDNYNREYIENLIIFYWMDFVISDEMYSTLFEIIEEQHNPKIIEETPLI